MFNQPFLDKLFPTGWEHSHFMQGYRPTVARIVLLVSAHPEDYRRLTVGLQSDIARYADALGVPDVVEMHRVLCIEAWLSGNDAPRLPDTAPKLSP